MKTKFLYLNGDDQVCCETDPKEILRIMIQKDPYGDFTIRPRLLGTNAKSLIEKIRKIAFETLVKYEGEIFIRANLSEDGSVAVSSCGRIASLQHMSEAIVECLPENESVDISKYNVYGPLRSLRCHIASIFGSTTIRKNGFKIGTSMKKPYDTLTVRKIPMDWERMINLLRNGPDEDAAAVIRMLTSKKIPTEQNEEVAVA